MSQLINGLNVLYPASDQIRQNFSIPKCDVPILAMTTHALRTEEEKCCRAGMNGYISKPIDVKMLSAKIAAIVEN